MNDETRREIEKCLQSDRDEWDFDRRDLEDRLLNLVDGVPKTFPQAPAMRKILLREIAAVTIRLLEKQ